MTWMILRILSKLGIVVIASPQSSLLIALMITLNFYYLSINDLVSTYIILTYNVSLIYISHWMIMITNVIHLMQTPIWTILSNLFNILQIVYIFLNRNLSSKCQNRIKWRKMSAFVIWILEVWAKTSKFFLAITLIWLAIGLPHLPLQKPGWKMLIVICLVSLVIACWKNIDQVG